MTETIQNVQLEAFEAATKAKRTFEIEDADRKVRAVADQITLRLNRLVTLAEAVRQDVADANERPLYLDSGAFRHDTETIDELLTALSEASQMLDNMRAADRTNDELMDEFKGRATAAVHDLGQHRQQQQQQPESPAFAMPAGGAYL